MFNLTPALLAMVHASREHAPDDDPSARPALSLLGSIDCFAYLSDDGVVWIVEGVFEHESVWRRATRREALGCVHAASRRLPQFAVLLPTRGPGDVACPACSGSGRFRSMPTWCFTCFGLGWLPPLPAD